MRKFFALMMVAVLALTLALALASCTKKAEDQSTTPSSTMPESSPADTAMAPADTMAH